MQITVRQLTRLYFIFSLLVMTYASCLSLRKMELGAYEEGNARIVTGLAFGLFILSAVKLLLSKEYKLYKPAFPIVCYCLFFVWSVIPTLLSNSTPTFSATLFNVINILLPMAALLVAYNITRNYGEMEWFHATFIAMFLMFVYHYAKIFTELNIFDGQSHLIASYATLYTLPLALLAKPKKVKLALVLITTVAILSSLKRAGAAALVLAIFAYLMVYMQTSKMKATTIAMVVASMLAFAILFLFMASSGDETLIERFQNLDKDNGSGRTVVWEMTAKMIEKSDAVSYVLGHGFNTVAEGSPISLSAHNDFLEVTYDFGLIGILLYLTAIISTLVYTIQMIRHRSTYAAPLAMLMVLYLFLSMTSHIIIYCFSYTVMLTFGYFIGSYKKEQEELCSEPTE